MQRLEPFVGEWKLEVNAPWAPADVDARTTFEWTLGGAFLIQRSQVDVPEAPDGLCVIAPAFGREGWTQHYFDSRGVVRLYDMTFDGRVWTLERTRPDFSDFNFAQRFFGEFSDDGNRIDGRFEITPGPDSREFELDFEITYTRVR